VSYDVLSQTAAEVADLENAPAVAIGPYLLKTEQTRLLRVISIYQKRRFPRAAPFAVHECARSRALEGDGQGGKRHCMEAAPTRPPDSALRLNNEAMASEDCFRVAREYGRMSGRRVAIGTSAPI